MSTAQTIARQLGFTLSMIGAKNLIDHGDGLSFKIGRNPKRVNHVEIKLDEGRDLYRVKFSRVPSVKALCRGAETVTVSEAADVYASQLKAVIESHTGLLAGF